MFFRVSGQLSWKAPWAGTKEHLPLRLSYSMEEDSSDSIFPTPQGLWEQEISCMAWLSLQSIDYALPHRTMEPMLMTCILSTTEELLVLPRLVRKVRLETQ